MDYTHYQMCKSIDGPLVTHVGGYTQTEMFSERHYPRCTCSAYKFSKRIINFGGQMVPPECKHILRAQEKTCGWHQAYSPEIQDEMGICPKCGGPTITVRWAI